jgi:hypothetical protein
LENGTHSEAANAMFMEPSQPKAKEPLWRVCRDKV